MNQKLTPEEKERKEKYEIALGVEVSVVSVPLNKDATKKEVIYLKEPDIQQLDAYLAMKEAHPLLARQNLFGALVLTADDQERIRLLTNKYVVMGVSFIIDKLTEFFVAEIKKN